jgi:hypothetical protein
MKLITSKSCFYFLIFLVSATKLENMHSDNLGKLVDFYVNPAPASIHLITEGRQWLRTDFYQIGLNEGQKTMEQIRQMFKQVSEKAKEIGQQVIGEIQKTGDQHTATFKFYGPKDQKELTAAIVTPPTSLGNSRKRPFLEEWFRGATSSPNPLDPDKHFTQILPDRSFRKKPAESKLVDSRSFFVRYGDEMKMEKVYSRFFSEEQRASRHGVVLLGSERQLDDGIEVSFLYFGPSDRVSAPF